MWIFCLTAISIGLLLQSVPVTSQTHHIHSSGHMHEEDNSDLLATFKDLGEILDGWSCYTSSVGSNCQNKVSKMCYSTKQNYFFKGNQVKISNLIDIKQECQKLCLGNQNCILWSFVPKILRRSSARCFHTYKNMRVNETKIYYEHGSSIMSTTCSTGYAGCFEDKVIVPDLTHQVSKHNKRVSTCRWKCLKRKDPYAGLQSPGECWCGKSFGLYNQSLFNGSECRIQYNQNAIYRTGSLYDGEMCILGKFAVQEFNGSGVLVYSDLTLKNCIMLCKSNRNCSLWSFNGSHCFVIMEMSLKSATNTTLSFIGSSASFTGFSECSDNNEKYTIFSKLVSRPTAGTNKTYFELAQFEKGNFNFSTHRILNTTSPTKQPKLFVGALTSTQILYNWRLFADVFLNGNFLSYSVREIQGHGLEQPVGAEKITISESLVAWMLVCPSEYKSFGCLLTAKDNEPNLKEYFCVHHQFTVPARIGTTVRIIGNWSIHLIEPSDCHLGYSFSHMWVTNHTQIDQIKLYTLALNRKQNSCKKMSPLTQTQPNLVSATEASNYLDQNSPLQNILSTRQAFVYQQFTTSSTVPSTSRILKKTFQHSQPSLSKAKVAATNNIVSHFKTLKLNGIQQVTIATTPTKNTAVHYTILKTKMYTSKQNSDKAVHKETVYQMNRHAAITDSGKHATVLSAMQVGETDDNLQSHANEHSYAFTMVAFIIAFVVVTLALFVVSCILFYVCRRDQVYEEHRINKKPPLAHTRNNVTTASPYFCSVILNNKSNKAPLVISTYYHSHEATVQLT
uniref:Uncharacterized LOC494398 n=1 Tax=Ciona intestinalis TaxID=7719 RepID=F6PY33_CIOIN